LGDYEIGLDETGNGCTRRARLHGAISQLGESLLPFGCQRDVIGMDSAEQVYRFAMDQMGVENKDMPEQGLRTMFSALKDRRAPAKRDPLIAADSAATVDKFNLGRFGRA